MFWKKNKKDFFGNVIGGSVRSSILGPIVAFGVGFGLERFLNWRNRKKREGEEHANESPSRGGDYYEKYGSKSNYDDE